MYIQPINISFKGHFSKSQPLKATMQNANINELIKFSQILDKMYKSNDKSLYILKEESLISELGRELVLTKFTNRNFKVVLSRQTPIGSDEIFYKDTLKVLNSYLETVY